MTWPFLSLLMALGTDIDECENYGGDPVCGAWRCENSPGSYRCVRGCQPGFHMAPTGDCIGEQGGGSLEEGWRRLPFVHAARNYFVLRTHYFCSCFKVCIFSYSRACAKTEEEC